MSSVMATPPGSSTGTQGDNHSTGRPMRLKVAYTFDDESKSNCLARYPHLVHSRAVQVDKDLLVGAVEFKTCILSMISSSPELVAKMSQDYSIYAYDYSEPGVPLVGCGLLSWAMTTVNNSSHGSDNPAPARHIITGRISCNNFGFFSNDEVKETLEVKFKLMPVQTFTQAQFVQSVHTYNALSKAIPGGFDASAWTNYLNQHPNILAPPGHCSNTSATPPVPPGAIDEALLDDSEAKSSHKNRPQPKRDGNGLFTPSEQSGGEPPKKKARTNAGRVRKPSGGSRKKATAALPPAPLSPIPELFQSSVPQFKESLHPQPSPAPPTPSPPENHIELVRGPSSISYISQEMGFSPEDGNSPAPPTVNSTIMASSPPMGHDDPTEETRVEFSPEPTSPVLPLLPSNEETPDPSQEYTQDLGCLFEDIKPEVVNHDSPSAEIQVPATQLEQETQLPSSMKPPALSTLSTVQDTTVSAAPSPISPHDIMQPKPKPKRKYPRKPKVAPTTPSEVVASSDIGEDGRKIKRSKSEKAARTAANVKERIHAQMVAAVSEGKLPTFCMNCGAIETPTWRKVSMKGDNEGVEGEGEGKLKKEKEVLLCNPCGLWHGSHKTMRPQDYWDGKKEEPTTKKPRSKKKKPTSAPVVPNQVSRQLSEPCTEPIIVPDEDEEQGLPMAPPLSAVSAKRLAMTPKGDRSAKGSDPEWEAVSAASKRAFQSSPAKRGSATSPIDLENLEPISQSPRRILFPTKPLSNCSPVRKSTSSGAETRQSNTAAIVGKENRAPEEIDAQTAGRELQRPTTPTKKRINPLHPRTPLSSPMKGGKLISPSPWNADIFVSGGKRRSCGSGIPTTPERRASQTTAPRCNLSPTSELLEKIMSMADMPATAGSVSVDLAGTSPDHLPGLSPIDPNQNFDFGDDIFGTDMTMPSSPPPLFNLGDANEDEVSGWGEFLPSSPEFNNVDYGLDIFEDMVAVGGVVEGEVGSVKSEKCSSAGTTPGATALTVDFSSYIDDTTKGLVTSS